MFSQIVVGILVAAGSYLVYNTHVKESQQFPAIFPENDYLADPVLFKFEDALTRFSRAIQIPTISFHDSNDIDYSKFFELQALLKTVSPLCMRN